MSSEPDRRRDDEGAIHIALFRYGVIAPLVEREDHAPGDVTALVKEIAARTHYLPGKGRVTVSVRTVYGWLRAYRTGGIDALKPRVRRDRGRSRKLSDTVLARAVQLRKENAKRWTSTLIDILRLEGTLDGCPSFHRATLDRHLDRRGASRRRLRVLAKKPTIKMRFDAFGDLWVGDYHHGPLVRGPDGKARAAKLGAFIDHTTRYPVADRYYLAENIASLRDCLLRALLRWGPPKKAYVDRGAVYRAEQLAYSLMRIECKLVHSKAYYSEGRGVIERWWQHADQFENEVSARDELLTLPERNRFWEAYRERRYCQKDHSDLGRPPAEAVAEVSPRPLDPEVARELFLVKEERTVHQKDCCVSVLGRRFRCEAFLRKRRVTVRFDPSDLSFCVIYFEGKRVQRAFPQEVNAKPEPHPDTEEVASSVDYLALLRDEYDQKLLEHARPLAYCELRVDEGFTVDRFVEVVSDLAGLKGLGVSQRGELASFWETFGPIPEELCRIGTEHAVRLHGRRRHARIYLHAIRTLILAHWRSRPSKEKKP